MNILCVANEAEITKALKQKRVGAVIMELRGENQDNEPKVECRVLVRSPKAARYISNQTNWQNTRAIGKIAEFSAPITSDDVLFQLGDLFGSICFS